MAVGQQGLLGIKARCISGFLMPKNFMANLAKIEKYLQQKKIRHKISDLGGEVYKVEDVIKVGINPDEILKTLIVRSTVKENLQFKDKYFALVLRGKDRVDFKKVRRLFGGPSTTLKVNCELAKPEEVKKVAGVPVGAVCPILLDIPIFIDKNAMNLNHINMGSGDLTKELEMDFSDLLGAIGEYKLVELTSAADK